MAYIELSPQQVSEHESFWSLSWKNSLKGVFCGRIYSAEVNLLEITFNHQQFIVKIKERQDSLSLKKGDLVLIQYQQAVRNTSLIFLDIAQIHLLAPSKAMPLSTSMQPATLVDWQNFMASIKEFFWQRDFREFRTPTLVSSPGIEEHIDVFKTHFHRGSYKTDLYLPTSPEFHLKKALSMGWNKIFEMKDCFRNDEGSPIHQPEFVMLEWYRAYSNLQSILQDTKELLNYLSQTLFQKPLDAEVKTVADVFKEYLHFQLEPHTSLLEMRELLRQHGISFLESDSWDDVYFRIFIEKIEPYLGKDRPCFLTKYPSSQAALARITSDGWADRFELYWKGIELANAFHELNDPQEQRRRFLKTNEKRQAAGRATLPLDEEFLQALEYGLPPSGGIALGVERLFMCFYQIQNIQEVRGFCLQV